MAPVLEDDVDLARLEALPGDLLGQGARLDLVAHLLEQALGDGDVGCRADPLVDRHLDGALGAGAGQVAAGCRRAAADGAALLPAGPPVLAAAGSATACRPMTCTAHDDQADHGYAGHPADPSTLLHAGRSSSCRLSRLLPVPLRSGAGLPRPG